MQITTLHWQWGCYWRNQLFHRENAIFLVFYVADLPLKIKKAPARITRQANDCPAPSASAGQKGFGKIAIEGTARASRPSAFATPQRVHPTQELAALTPRHHTEFLRRYPLASGYPCRTFKRCRARYTVRRTAANPSLRKGQWENAKPVRHLRFVRHP